MSRSTHMLMALWPACAAPATPSTKKPELPRHKDNDKMKNRKTQHLALGLACLLLAAGCGDGGGSDGPSNAAGVSQILSQVESVEAGVIASVRTGAVPPASGGPDATTADSGTVVNGGSSLVSLLAAAPAKRVYVWVRANGEVLDGYWDVELPASRTDIRIQVTIAQQADRVATAFDCIYALVDASGRVGAPATAAVRIVPVGTGDIQISVSWDRPTDVDLHVVEPSGEEIYFGHDVASSGGNLDLDSNAGCGIDGVNNENVTWPSGRAPRGRYIVRVTYWSSCGEPATNYVVTIQRGGAPETFRGTLTGDGTRGGAGSGTTIAEFNY